MARLITSGFEAPFSPTEEFWEQWAGTANTEAASWSAGGRLLRALPGTGSRFGRSTRLIGGEHNCHTYDSNDNQTSAFKRNLNATPSELWGRFAWRQTSAVRVGNGRIFEFHLNGIGAICSIVEHDFGNNDFIGAKLLSNSGAVLQTQNTTVFATSSTQWHLCEFHLVLAGSAGRLEFWVNGVKQLDFFGALAGPGGEVITDSLIIGQGGPSAGQVFNTSSRRQYDDISINDTTGTINKGRIGDGVIIRRVPRFPGATTQLLSDLGTATAGVNFRRLNRDDDLNGFVGAITPGDRDSYTMSNERQGHNNEGMGMPAFHGSAAAIVFQARAIQNGPSIANIRYSAKPPSQVEFFTPAAPGVPIATDGLLTANHQVELNPNTGDPFTHADLDGIEAGFSLEA